MAGAKVFDQLEVIQANVRAGVVTLCRIAPTIVTDQNRGYIERHRGMVGEVGQLRDVTAESNQIATRGRDRFAIEIVVAENEVNRPIQGFGQASQLIGNIVSFGQIAGDQNGVWIEFQQFRHPRLPNIEFGMIKVWVGDPSDSAKRLIQGDVATT